MRKALAEAVVIYPGRVIKHGETDAVVLRALKDALDRALVLSGEQALRLDPTKPSFGLQMKQAVRLFQARNQDAFGQPLKVDGMVGPMTWAALFGHSTVYTATQASDPFLAAVLKVAHGEADQGVREVPPNSNRGPRVDLYLASVNEVPGVAWCCAFTYWCFEQAARQAGRNNPMVKTAGVMKHWERSPAKGARRIAAKDAMNNPSLVRPGMVFIISTGGGLGHTGFVDSVAGWLIRTVEGNTNGSGSREGDGVQRLPRDLGDINMGFIDYAGL